MRIKPHHAPPVWHSETIHTTEEMPEKQPEQDTDQTRTVEVDIVEASMRFAKKSRDEQDEIAEAIHKTITPESVRAAILGVAQLSNKFCNQACLVDFLSKEANKLPRCQFLAAWSTSMFILVLSVYIWRYIQ